MKRRICTTLGASLLATFILQTRLAEAGPNQHQVSGEEILDRIISDNYDSNTHLYAEQITTATLTPSSDSYLWSATHLLRAFMWGAMVDPTKYQAGLESYVAAVSQYWQNGAGCYNNEDAGCYGSSTGGGTPYFDDNALFDSALTDIYQKVYPNADMLSMAVIAFTYDMNARDEQWTVPQITSQLGQGLLFSMATTPTGLSAERLFEITADTNYAFAGTTWYNIFTDLNVAMMDSNTLLLNQGSFYWTNAPNADGIWSITNLDGGTWSLEKQGDPSANVRGFRAYQTSYVIELAVKLYMDTQNAAYLQEAQAIAGNVLDHWYTPDAGFGEISFWGGNDSVDALMDLHNVDPDPKWFGAAVDIVNFIIKNGRDTSGYYPNGASDVGAWNLVRTGTAAPATVDMMSQAAAANAILRVAWCEQDAVCSGAAPADAGSTSDAGGGTSDASATGGSTDGGSSSDATIGNTDATAGNTEEGDSGGAAAAGTSSTGSSSCACSAAGTKRAPTPGFFALLAGLATAVARRRRARKSRRA